MEICWGVWKNITLHLLLSVTNSSWFFEDISSRSSPKSAFDQSPARRGNLKFSLPFGNGDKRLPSSRPIILNQSSNQMFLLIASPGSVRPRQQQQTDRRRSVSTSLWKSLAHVTWNAKLHFTFWMDTMKANQNINIAEHKSVPAGWALSGPLSDRWYGFWQCTAIVEAAIWGGSGPLTSFSLFLLDFLSIEIKPVWCRTSCSQPWPSIIHSLFFSQRVKIPPHTPILPPIPKMVILHPDWFSLTPAFSFLFRYCFSSLIHTFMSRLFYQDFVLSELFLLYKTTSSVDGTLIAALCPRLSSIVLAPLLSLFPLWLIYGLWNCVCLDVPANPTSSVSSVYLLKIWDNVPLPVFCYDGIIVGRLWCYLTDFQNTLPSSLLLLL